MMEKYFQKTKQPPIGELLVVLYHDNTEGVGIYVDDLGPTHPPVWMVQNDTYGNIDDNFYFALEKRVDGWRHMTDDEKKKFDEFNSINFK